MSGFRYAIWAGLVLIIGIVTWIWYPSRFGLWAQNISWSEEVLLHDGRVIVAKVDVKCGRREIDQSCGVPESTTLTFDPPGGGGRVTWRSDGNVNLDILELDGEVAFVAVHALTCQEAARLGGPGDMRIVYQYLNGQWQIIPLKDLPDQLSKYNLRGGVARYERRLFQSYSGMMLSLREKKETMSRRGALSYKEGPRGGAAYRMTCGSASSGGMFRGVEGS